MEQPTPPKRAALEVSFSPRWPIVLLLLLVAGLLPYVWVVVVGGGNGAASLLALLVLGALAAVGARAVLRSWRRGWLLRLDAEGVTVRGHPTVAWSSIAEVRLSDFRSAGSPGMSSGMMQAIAFIPVEGVVLPALPRSGNAELYAENVERRHGTRLLMLSPWKTASVAEIAAAVQTFGGVPVVRTPWPS